MTRVSIIGAGAWGSAIGLSAHRAGSEVTFWTHLDDHAQEMLQTRENKPFLPGIPLPKEIQITSNLEEACANADILVMSIPAQVTRDVATKMAPFVSDNSYLIIASKGIETSTDKLMSEVLTETIPQAACAVLSGPTFADEVGQNLPTALTLASDNIQTSTHLGRAFNHQNFRVYASEDIIGTQIGGSLKNVLAIASGIIVGKKLGANAHASLITRGLVEMKRLTEALGGNPATLNGLSGMGDIVLTCSNPKSRNMSFGLELGQGKTITEIQAQYNKVFEGVATSQTITRLREKTGVHMPICESVDKILNHGLSVEEGMQQILSRPPKPEELF